MMDVFLFGATVAVTIVYMKKKNKRNESGLSEGDEDLQLQLRKKLIDKTSLNATERISIVTPDNVVVEGGGIRSEMRLLNLWHRATVSTKCSLFVV